MDTSWFAQKSRITQAPQPAPDFHAAIRNGEAWGSEANMTHKTLRLEGHAILYNSTTYHPNQKTGLVREGGSAAAA